jgi:hypothetical protein
MVDAADGPLIAVAPEGHKTSPCAVWRPTPPLVRAIDAYVDALDLKELGFSGSGSDGGERRRIQLPFLDFRSRQR